MLAAGLVNDRLSRKQVMIVTDLARVFIVLAMLFVHDAGFLYALLTVETLMAAFFEPARNAVIPNIVAPETLDVANTLSASTWSSVLAIGAMLGGIVSALFGRNVVFLINALSFLASAYFISRMTFDEPHRSGSQPLGRSSTLEGIRYIRARPRLFASLFIKTGTGSLAACWVLFPIFASRVFLLPGLSPQRNTVLVTSLLAGARGLGALAGPLLTSGWAQSNERRMVRLSMFGFLIAGFGYIAFSQAPALPLAWVLLLVATSGGAILWVNSTTLLQLNSEDRFRGRVFAADLAIAMFTVAASGFASGRAIDSGISVRHVAAALGVLQLILAFGWTFALRLWD
jgi:predicted MFS family arabinose efflux permease